MSATRNSRHLIGAGLLWVVLTAIGEVILFAWEFLPEQYAREARVVDDAFILLAVLGIPVFTFVVAVLVYSALRFRTTDDTLADGPPIKGSNKVVGVWLAITSALALAVLINPGLVGLAELRADAEADLVIKVDSQRWQWKLTYPNGAVVSEELVLPVNTRVRFDITSADILHSFWVPAFRAKIDAVPGRITQLYITPTKTGTFEEDPTLRLQCAELCGLGHSRMAIPVRVLSEADFDAWLSTQTASAEVNG